MPSVSRNPQGLFETRLARERARLRTERPAAPAVSTIFTHIPDSSLQIFMDAVRRFDHEPVLRYSQRLGLLKQAQALGIRRFDANLIIAAMEREAHPSQTVPRQQAGGYDRWVAWGVAAGVQIALLAGVWCFFRS